MSKGTGGPVEMTMKKMWLKWTNENHTFENVTLSKADQDAFSGAVKEYMDFERDDMGKPISGAKCWLPSLKYTFPAVPKPGEKAKPLTNDQKQQNLVFSRECRKLWREALSDLRQRIADGVSKLERKKYGDRGGDRDRDEDDDRDRDGDRDRERERSRKDYESSTKAGAAGEMNSKSSHDYGGSSSISPATSKKFELVVLNEISLKRLREWVDEDEDKMLEREREKLQEKNEEAKKMHQQFVRKKDE